MAMATMLVCTLRRCAISLAAFDARYDAPLYFCMYARLVMDGLCSLLVFKNSNALQFIRIVRIGKGGSI